MKYITIERCFDCPKYQYGFGSGCCGLSQKQIRFVNGESIPDWCELPDLTKTVNETGSCVKAQGSSQWYLFDEQKGSRQKRPKEKKWVLVLCHSKIEEFPDPIIVGYMKNAAGDKQSPYFVTPGRNAGPAYAWCDCLPENFEYPPGIAKE